LRGEILIVDDSLTVRMDLADALRAAGMGATPVASLAEARGALAGRRFGLVILDVMLPDGDGVQLLEEIRAAGPNADAPVMFLSSEAEVKDRVRGLARGANDYVGKPYDTEYVVARARELLRVETDGLAPEATILVIDDSPTYREEVRGWLEARGYRVAIAGSGEEGLRVAAVLRPSAIVVDGVLPGIDGRTVIRHLRLDPALRRTPCVLLTGSGDATDEILAFEAGADAYVRKDEPEDVVLARLAAATRGARERETLSPASLLGPRKVLGVDRDARFLKGLAAALGGQGYELVTATTTDAALQLLAVQPMDCVILELGLPGGDTESACERIKSAPAIRNTPVIAVAPLDDRETMIRALESGADDCVPRSTGLEAIKARVVAQIRRRQMEEETRRIREQQLLTELASAEARAARQLADVRAQLIAEVEARNNELEAFSYSVSHDLRAPLRSIDGFSAALEEYGDRLDERGRDALRRVRAATRRMGQLIEDLLHLSKVVRAELRRTRIDLSLLARAVAAELVRADPSRQVEVVIQPGLVMEGDEGLVRIVLENLFGNAFKFTARVPSARIELGYSAGERAFYLRDNGVGFDMAYAGRLFSAFQRLHRESEYPGTGIGLATVQRIIQRHGGKIWAQSEVGQGTTFFWTLALRAASDVPNGENR
jgi:two-component system NtrC family sensor kinase